MTVAAFLCFALAGIICVASPSLSLLYPGASISGAIYASALLIAGVVLTAASILRGALERGFEGLTPKAATDEPVLELTQRAPVSQEPLSSTARETTPIPAPRAAASAAGLVAGRPMAFEVEPAGGAARRFLFAGAARARSGERSRF